MPLSLRVQGNADRQSIQARPALGKILMMRMDVPVCVWIPLQTVPLGVQPAVLVGAPLVCPCLGAWADQNGRMSLDICYDFSELQ